MFRKRSRKLAEYLRPAVGSQAASLRGGFTLLEVMLAVAIIGLVAMSIFRFVDSTLRVVAAINEGSGDLEQVESLCRMLQYQFNDLPVSQQGAILGQPHQFNGFAADELQWRCSAGNGLFTSHAAGDYQVTLMVKTNPKSNTPELGLRRVLFKGDPNAFNWLPLVSGIKAMESRFFDARLNTWVEKWTDVQTRPNLVRLKFWGEQGGEPYEAVLSVPKVMLLANPGGMPMTPPTPGNNPGIGIRR